MIINGVQYASHCATCNKGFGSRNSYIQHKKDVHAYVPNYVHRQTHEEENTCFECFDTFNKYQDLEKHIKAKHGATSKCLQCNTFGSSAWAQSHAMTARCSGF